MTANMDDFFLWDPCFKHKLKLDFTNAIKFSEHLLCKGKLRLHIHHVLNLHHKYFPILPLNTQIWKKVCSYP